MFSKLDMKKILIGIVIMMGFAGSCVADSGQDLNIEANKLREEGKTFESLETYNQAFAQLLKEQDYRGVLSVLSGRSIAWKHLFYREEDPIYAILSLNDVEAMAHISEEYQFGDMEYLIQFLFGQSYILLNDFESAEIAFTRALELYPTNSGEKGDWMVHLGESFYGNGHTYEGKEMIFEGIEWIQNHSRGTDPFRINVWLSGAYLKLAKFLHNENQDEAKVYLEKAEQIILNDPQLVIRKEQLEKLKRLFS